MEAQQQMMMQQHAHALRGMQQQLHQQTQNLQLQYQGAVNRIGMQAGDLVQQARQAAAVNAQNLIQAQNTGPTAAETVVDPPTTENTDPTAGSAMPTGTGEALEVGADTSQSHQDLSALQDQLGGAGEGGGDAFGFPEAPPAEPAVAPKPGFSAGGIEGLTEELEEKLQAPPVKIADPLPSGIRVNLRSKRQVQIGKELRRARLEQEQQKMPMQVAFDVRERQALEQAGGPNPKKPKRRRASCRGRLGWEQNR